jgi:hypothetical protein
MASGFPTHGTAQSQSPLYLRRAMLLQGQLEVARKGSLGLRHPQAAPLSVVCRCARTAGNTISALSQRRFFARPFGTERLRHWVGTGSALRCRGGCVRGARAFSNNSGISRPRTSSTRCATPSWRLIGSRTSGADGRRGPPQHRAVDDKPLRRNSPRSAPEGLIAKTAVLVGTAAFIARLSILIYFAAASCGCGDGLGSDVSIRIFHCPFSRTSRAVQITVRSRGSPFSLLPVTRASSENSMHPAC